MRSWPWAIDPAALGDLDGALVEDGTGAVFRGPGGVHALLRDLDGPIPHADVVWAQVGSVREVRAAAAGGFPLWLRGLEGGGPTGDATALVLIRAAVATGRRWVCEGLSERAAAAALAVGAAGVVVDAPLWCTAGSSAPPEVQAALKAAAATDTVLSGELAGAHERALKRGPLAFPAPQNAPDAAAYAGWAAGDALRHWVDAVRARRSRIDLRSLHADPVGSGRPIAQGPMANVSEGAGLAKAVRAAGGIPFAALGALDPHQAQEVLERWAHEVPAPWGVGVIGFDVMPFRDAHLAAIAALGDRGPAVITLAGASPALAVELERRGHRCWLHTPTGALAARALGDGVTGVIFEGHEAGGHVGRLTSVGLWEEGLAAVEAAERGSTVVLAGGIGDTVSATFAAAMASDAVAAGAQLVLQAGTAFLLSHEAVEHGHVTPLYQSQALSADTTVLVGSTVNLPLRCVPNAFTAAARADEASWDQQALPRAERRLRLEQQNLGRTRIAAKGVERNPEPGARYRAVPLGRQNDEGAFTVGQGALVTPRVQSVREIVLALTQGAAPPRWGAVSAVPSRPPPARPPPSAEGAIAITGLGCVLPGALDVASFFRNLLEGVDAVGPIPEERWRSDRYFDPTSVTGSRTYTRHAGAIRGFSFDPLPFRIPPNTVRTMDPSQRLALTAAAEAIRSAGLDRRPIDRRRAGVVVGNAMGGEFAKSAAVRVRFREVLAAVEEDERAHGRTIPDLHAFERRVEEILTPRLPPVEVDSMAGMLSNVVAGRIAAWLDWMGGNLTVDAACAASLAALSVAADWLRLGRCDVVLAGGVDTDLTPEAYVGFCRTHALSHHGSAPFSARADGFVMGEGAAMFVLQRLEDAERSGAPIWAVIRGIGASSDGRGRGITAPRPEGQALAIARAYDEAGWTADDIGVVEAHGTGTALGDETEVQVLSRAFERAAGPVWLGSVKSMIGHLKSAAGAAGVLKATLSLGAGVVFPTLHATPFHPDLKLTGGPFRLARAPVALPRPRASVSAFGFGGTNYHVLLEAYRGAPHAQLVPLRERAAEVLVPSEVGAWRGDERVPLLVAYAGASREALARDVSQDRPTTAAAAAGAPWRLALLADPADRPAAVARAATWLRDGGRGALGREAFLGEGPAEPVVLVFSGQGTQQRAVLEAFARVPAAARAMAALGGPLPPFGSDPAALHRWLYRAQIGGAALIAGCCPVAATVGHSLGAYAALVAAGWASAADLAPVVAARGDALAACPPGRMLAASLTEGEARELGVAIAAVNAPDRVVLSGAEEALAPIAARLGPSRARWVDVERAYHSPLVASALAPLRAALAGVRLAPGPTAVWSARTGAPVTDAAEDLVEGLLAPVRFDAVVRALVAAGHRRFVEIGGSAGRTIDRAGGQSVSLDGDLAVAAAALLAWGHPGLAAALPGAAIELALPAPAAPDRPAPRRPAARAPAPRAAPDDLRARADAVQDLRIAALADPTLEPTWREARRALLHALAARDAGPTVLADAPPDADDEDDAPPSPPPAIAPPEPAQPEPGPRPDLSTSVREVVVSTVAGVTGYPPEMLTDGANLEADLGIDSIRKMEILGALEKRLGFRTAEADYARLADADLAGLVAHVEARMATAAPAPAPVAAAHLAVPAPRAARTNGALRAVHDLIVVPAGQTPLQVVRALAGSIGGRGALLALVPDDPGGAAAVGWLRAAARELGRPLVAVRGAPSPDALGHLEEGVYTWTPDGPALEGALPVTARPGRALPQGCVVLATGGARGILIPCLQALAPFAPRVVLLGRSEGGERALRTAGLDGRYVRGDATVAEDVRAAAAAAREAYGRVDLVVHAAGVLRDGPLRAATDDDHEAVVAPKWDGARHLVHATRGDDLVAFCVFSSIVAHVGNPGQASYAAANAAMERVQHPRAPTVALAYTAWAEVGMAADPRIAALLGARGIRALPPEVGAEAFRAVVTSDLVGTVLVTADPIPDAIAPGWPLGPPSAWAPGRIVVPVPLDPRSPPLADHRVAGRPLVPAAMWFAAVLEAAALATGRAGSWAVDGLDILAPTFVDRARDDVALALTADGEGWRASITAGGAEVCRAQVRPWRAAEAEAPPAPLADGEPAEGLYRPDLLFHGPAWQVLRRMRTSGSGAEAELSGAVVVDGPTAVASAMDGVHQLLAAWSEREVGWLGLPVGADRWVALDFGAGPVHVSTVAAVTARELQADVVVRDARGRVVLRGEGVRLRAARRQEAP